MRNDVITRMTAIAPIVMSGIAVALVIGQLAPGRYRAAARRGHRGTPLADPDGQLPVIAIFAIRLLPRAPRAAAVGLAVQIAAALVAVAAVFLLGW